MVNEPDFTVIRISRTNYEELRKHGHTPETFNDIITKILAENKAISIITEDQ
jgi:hypothetical protein